MLKLERTRKTTMDKVVTRLLCYRKLLLHHHRHIKFNQLEPLQQITAGRNLSQLQQCHDDAASKGILQDHNDKHEEGGDKVQDHGLVPQGRCLESSSSVDNQGNITESSVDVTKPTKSSAIVQDPLSSPDSSNGCNIYQNNSLNDSSEKRLASDDGKSRKKEPPVAPDPETCCESGCVNCVWIKYAEEVKDYYPDHEEKLKEILDLIEDYNVKMFVRMELGIKK